MKNINRQKGVVQLFFLFLILATTLWYFKVDVRGFVDSHPEIKKFCLDLFEHLKWAWSTYLSDTVFFVWNTVLVGGLWKGIILPVVTFIINH
jgi:hypothetical protein